MAREIRGKGERSAEHVLSSVAKGGGCSVKIVLVLGAFCVLYAMNIIKISALTKLKNHQFHYYEWYLLYIYPAKGSLF